MCGLATTCTLRRASAGVPTPSSASTTAGFFGSYPGGARGLCASCALCLQAPFDDSASTTVTGVVSPPPPAPTPPLPPPSPPPPCRSRVEPAVYHPRVIHRDHRHTHPMVTRQTAGVLRPRALSDPDVSS
jgi:hypothetical protein